MPSFPPWIGNSNPTDQQKNEYIRQLKAALIDIATLTTSESGTYTGNGSATQVISLTNSLLVPKFVAIYRLNGTMLVAFTFTSMEQGNGTAFIVEQGTTSPSAPTNRISNLSSGEFTVGGASGTGLNINTYTYYWFVLGQQS